MSSDQERANPAFCPRPHTGIGRDREQVHHPLASPRGRGRCQAALRLSVAHIRCCFCQSSVEAMRRTSVSLITSRPCSVRGRKRICSRMSGARFSSGMTGLHSAVDSLALLLRPQGPGKCHVLTGELSQFRLLCQSWIREMAASVACEQEDESDSTVIPFRPRCRRYSVTRAVHAA